MYPIFKVSEKSESSYINYLINANAITMVDGSKWIQWALDRKKEGQPIESIVKIAIILNKVHNKYENTNKQQF